MKNNGKIDKVIAEELGDQKRMGNAKFTTKKTSSTKSESNMKAPYTKDLKTPYANDNAAYSKKRADKKKGAYLKGKW